MNDTAQKVQAIIDARRHGDFAPILPKLQAIVDEAMAEETEPCDE